MKKLLMLVTLAVASVSFAQKKEPKAAEPAKPAEAKPAEAAKPAAEAPKDIIDTAVAAGSFKTLATALTEAGLIETLKGKGPFTVFAPTDEAFAKIAKKDLDALLKDKKKLTAVLTYHVVPGSIPAAEVLKLKDGTKVKTVEGREITVGIKDGKVKVDGANVVKTDVTASNGVIHVIDTVIMPK
ncbi:MAG: fasciclin domain-containing protein [Myxococcaceae bacterium]|jgi:uncharacterized surface protein with fasciclin (FAS1) repeats|nr:fasciclin domain-containing protein [Myxococcaceae bacterium]